MFDARIDGLMKSRYEWRGWSGLLRSPHISCQPLADIISSKAELHAALPSQDVSRSSDVLTLGNIADPRLHRLNEFFSERGYTAAQLQFARLRNVIVDTSLAICMQEDGTLVNETTNVARVIDPTLRSATFLKRKPYKAHPITTPVLHCFHRASAAYGHFVFDCLAPIAFFRREIVEGRLKVLLPAFFPKWGAEHLAAIGIDPDRHILRMKGKTAICSDLLLYTGIDTSNSVHPHPDICAEMRRVVGHGTSSTKRRIYLSRRNQTNYSDRVIDNEPDVIEALQNLGVVCVEPGNLSFLDQVGVFRGADIIVGAHGSTFGNIAFSRPGTTLVDLMPADWIGYWDSERGAERWALNLTTLFRLNYRVHLTPSRTEPRGRHRPRIVSTVDIPRLVRDLKSI